MHVCEHVKEVMQRSRKNLGWILRTDSEFVVMMGTTRKKERGKLKLGKNLK